jgi:hypothetical protein
VGTVTGEVACERVPAATQGRRVLLQAAAVLAVVALLVAVVVDRRLPGTALLVACLAPALLQGLVLVQGRRGDRPGGDEPEQFTERWGFRVVEPSGRAVDCTLTGRLTDPVRRGEVVEVYGRTVRPDVVRVRELVVVADQRAIRGQAPAGVLLIRVADAATVVLAVVGVLAVVVTVVS